MRQVRKVSVFHILEFIFHPMANEGGLFSRKSCSVLISKKVAVAAAGSGEGCPPRGQCGAVRVVSEIPKEGC